MRGRTRWSYVPGASLIGSWGRGWACVWSVHCELCPVALVYTSRASNTHTHTSIGTGVHLYTHSGILCTKQQRGQTWQTHTLCMARFTLPSFSVSGNFQWKHPHLYLICIIVLCSQEFYRLYIYILFWSEITIQQYLKNEEILKIGRALQFFLFFLLFSPTII